MKAILLIFLFALVASSEQPQPQYPNFEKFMTCVKAGLKKDENLPAILRAFDEAFKTKSLVPIISMAHKKLPELLELGKTCYKESLSTEVELHGIFGDIGDMLKGLWNDLVSIGKTAWNNILGDVKSIFDNKGQNLINDIWEGLKATGKEILSSLIDCAKDALKNLILDALSDPSNAIKHLNESLKNIPSLVKDKALGFRLPEDSITYMTMKDIENLIKGVRTDVRNEVRNALDQGRSYAMGVCQKLIDTDKLDLCKYINSF